MSRRVHSLQTGAATPIGPRAGHVFSISPVARKCTSSARRSSTMRSSASVVCLASQPCHPDAQDGQSPSSEPGSSRGSFVVRGSDSWWSVIVGGSVARHRLSRLRAPIDEVHDEGPLLHHRSGNRTSPQHTTDDCSDPQVRLRPAEISPNCWLGGGVCRWPAPPQQVT